MVLLSMDLSSASLTLREAVIQRVNAVDRRVTSQNLLLLASHTHFGPSHFHDAEVYNENMSSEEGYDQRLVDWLATRAADAVLKALGSMDPVEAAWTDTVLPGLVVNRSPEAHAEASDATPLAGDHVASDSYRRRATDSTARILVLTRRTTGGSIVLGGWWSFGYHPMTHAIASDFYDADVPGRLSEALASALRVGASGEVVFAYGNGANGDVMPTSVSPYPCHASVPWYLGRRKREGEVRTERERVLCVTERARAVESTVTSMSAILVPAIAAAAERGSSDVAVSAASRYVDLRDPTLSPPLCPVPSQGLASVGGAEGARTRFDDVRFGEGHLVIGEGLRLPTPSGCHGHKLQASWLTRKMIGATDDALPRHAVLTVVRIADRLVVGIPFEPTITSARRLRAAVLDAVASHGVREVIIAGLANTYVGYLAAPEEYPLQHYEGASTLYGPGTLDAVTALARSTALAAVAHEDPAPFPLSIRVNRGSDRGAP